MLINLKSSEKVVFERELDSIEELEATVYVNIDTDNKLYTVSTKPELKGVDIDCYYGNDFIYLSDLLHSIENSLKCNYEINKNYYYLSGIKNINWLNKRTTIK